VHHLFFSDADYITLGNQIKCNPAVKTAEDRDAIFQAVLDGRIDIIATDHAPHTWEEKSAPYADAPAGLPLVQHGLRMMLSHRAAGRITLEQIVEWMCHRPAQCFAIEERGYLDEGAYADLVLVDPDDLVPITRESLLYKCGWSPLEGRTLPGRIVGTWVNGERVVEDGTVIGAPAGRRLTFDR
jgi:dihydroorotase